MTIELQARRERLEVALRALQEELALVNTELAKRPEQPALNDVFFFERIVPHLVRVSGGLTSSAIMAALVRNGHEITEGSLRTFLSRLKARGDLTTFGVSRPFKWQVGPKYAEKISKLGVVVAEQPASWRNK
ncbi:hypothetical protein [Devosia sp.]|uniref:hypothetical protein n=1 Tax=Devosia sp. TaxID=1871048 RepID=UPI003BA9E389